MLEEMKPQQFDGWWQYYKLKPWGGDWHRTSLQTSRGINMLRGIASSLGGAKLDDSDLLEDDAFVPKWRRPGDDPYQQEIAAQCAAADSLEGFGV